MHLQLYFSSATWWLWWNCFPGGSRSSTVLWYKALKEGRPTGYEDSFVCGGQASIWGGQHCLGNRIFCCWRSCLGGEAPWAVSNAAKNVAFIIWSLIQISLNQDLSEKWPLLWSSSAGWMLSVHSHIHEETVFLGDVSQSSGGEGELLYCMPSQQTSSSTLGSCFC